MNPSYEEKRSLLLEMIAFSTVDGILHRNEYLFLQLIATDLAITAEEFKDLFHLELPSTPIKSEFMRINQFYRLALLMHSDGVLHAKEMQSIYEIGLKMGLNPSASKRVLQLMQKSKSPIVDPQRFIAYFKEQHN